MEPKAGKGKWKPPAIILSLTNMSNTRRRDTRAMAGFMSNNTDQSGARANSEGTLVMSATYANDRPSERTVNKVWPGFSQSTKLDTKAISRDPEVVKAYEDDPLVHDKITSSFYLSAYQAGLWALDHADEIHLPLLLFHGTEDQLTSYEASKEFAKKAGDFVTFRLFNGAFHEIHNDLCKQELFDLMINWLDSRVGNEEEE